VVVVVVVVVVVGGADGSVVVVVSAAPARGDGEGPIRKTDSASAITATAIVEYVIRRCIGSSTFCR
jgi:hypothetical protein